MSFLERIARSVGLTVIDEDLSIDEATRLISDRAEQALNDRASSHDKQTLIQTLQHKLKSVKERLDIKVILTVSSTGEPRETAFLFSAFVYRCSKVQRYSDPRNLLFIRQPTGPLAISSFFISF